VIATTGDPVCAPPIGLHFLVDRRNLSEKYMRVITAVRPAVIGDWLTYWRMFLLVLAANTIIATLAWMLVDLLMK
jgi:hypothetical protein